MKTLCLWGLALLSFAGCRSPSSVCQFDYEAADPSSDPLWVEVQRECNLVATHRYWKEQPQMELGLAIETKREKDPFHITPACDEALQAAIAFDDNLSVSYADLTAANLRRAVQVLFFHPFMRTEGDWILQAPTPKGDNLVEIPFLDVHYTQFMPYDDGKKTLSSHFFNREVRDYFCEHVEIVTHDTHPGYDARVRDGHLYLSDSFGKKGTSASGKYKVASTLYHEMVHTEKNGGHERCNDKVDDHLASLAKEHPEWLFCDHASGGTYTRQAGAEVALSVAGLFYQVDGESLITEEDAFAFLKRSCSIATGRSNRLRQRYKGDLDCEQAAEALLWSLRY